MYKGLFVKMQYIKVVKIILHHLSDKIHKPLKTCYLC
jgi:hypothetical protein